MSNQFEWGNGIAGFKLIDEEEAKKMPLHIDISENKVLWRAYQRTLQKGLEEGLQQGLEQGFQQGLQQGVHEGQVGLLRRQIERRFGPLPAWAEQDLQAAPREVLEKIGIRLLEAESIEQLFA